MATATFRPNDNGDTIEFTTTCSYNWQCVDDGVDWGSSSDRNERNGVTAGDLYDIFKYTLSGIDSGAAISTITVHWVQQQSSFEEAPQGGAVIRYDGSQKQSPYQNNSALNTDAAYSYVFATPPANPSTWQDIFDNGNLPSLQFGYLGDDRGGFKDELRYNSVWLQIDYTITASAHQAPTTLYIEGTSSGYTNATATPMFSAIFNSEYTNDTISQAFIEVAEATLSFDSPFATSGWVTVASCQEGNRSGNAWYNDDGASGSWSTAGTLYSNPTYYWRIKFQNSHGETPWSTTSSFSGINRSWANDNYIFRRKLLYNRAHATVCKGATATFTFKTGNRTIVAKNGCFNEAIQASGGCHIDTYGSHSYIAYLSDPYITDGKYSAFVQAIDTSVTPPVIGSPYRLMSADTTDDTHNSPVLCCDNDGYIHYFRATHYSALKYLRSYQSDISGCLSGEDTGATLWFDPVNNDLSPYVPTGGAMVYLCAFVDPITNSVYLFYRTGSTQVVYFVISDHGATWKGPWTVIDDNQVEADRVYAYGVRMNRTSRRFHMAFTYNQKDVEDLERGIWYIYSDLDTSTPATPYVSWKWADGTHAGTVESKPVGVSNGQATTWATMCRKSVIFTEQWDDSIIPGTQWEAKSFIENLELSGDDPVIFWEQKPRPGLPAARYSATDETDIVCARYTATIGESGGVWKKTFINENVPNQDLTMRVRRSGVAVMGDLDGSLHMWMPVDGRPKWRRVPTLDVYSTNCTASPAGASLWECVDDGLTQCDGDYSKVIVQGAGNGEFFVGGFGQPSSDKEILSVEVEAIVKIDGTGATAYLGISNGIAATAYTASSDFLDDGTANFGVYRYWRNEWIKNPWTDSAWTATTIGSLSIGIQSSDGATIHVTRFYPRVEYTTASNRDWTATELWKFISRDKGDTWSISEISRNSHIGVAMLSQKSWLSGDRREVVWSSGNDIFYSYDDPYGLVQYTGYDLKMYFNNTEIDRLVDYPNMTDSQVLYKVQSTILVNEVASKTGDYYIYYGNRDETTRPLSAPGSVYHYFQNYEILPKGKHLASLNDLVGATVVEITSAPVAYSSPPEHANKIYAGNISVDHTVTEAVKYIFPTPPFGAIFSIGEWTEFIGGMHHECTTAGGTFSFKHDNTDWIEGPYNDDIDGVLTPDKAKAESGQIVDYDIYVTPYGRVSMWYNGRLCMYERALDTTGSIQSFRTNCTDGHYYTDYVRIAARSDIALDYRYLNSAHPSIDILPRVEGTIQRVVVFPTTHVQTATYDSTYDGYHFNVSHVYPTVSRTQIKISSYMHASGTVPSHATLKCYMYEAESAAYGSIIASFSKRVDYTVLDTYIYSTMFLDPIDIYDRTSFRVACLSNGTEWSWVKANIEEIIHWRGKEGQPRMIVGTTEAKGVYGDISLIGAGRSQIWGLLYVNGIKQRIAGGMPLGINSQFLLSGISPALNNQKIEETKQTPIGVLADRAEQFGMPVEHQLGIYHSSLLPLEYFGQVEYVNGVITEYVQDQDFTYSVPLEYSLLVDDYQNVPIEGSTEVQHTGQIPIEPGEIVPVFIGGLPVAFTEALEESQKVIIEFGKLLAQGVKIPTDYLTDQEIGSAAPIAFTTKFGESSVSPVEYSGSIKDYANVIFIEFTESVDVSEEAPIEYAELVPVYTGAIPVEALQEQAVINTVPIEHGRSILDVSIVPVEYLKEVSDTGRQLIGYIQGISVSNNLPTEILSTSESYSGLMRISLGSGLIISNKTPIEIQKEEAVGESIPIQVILDVLTDHAVPIEYNKGFSAIGRTPIFAAVGVTSSDKLPIEIVSQVVEIATNAIPVEYIQSQTISNSIPMSYLVSLTETDRAVIDYLKGLTDATKINIEMTAKQESSGPTPIELLKAIVADAETPVAVLSKISDGIQSHIEYITNQQFGEKIAIEFSKAMAESASSPIEYLKSILGISASYTEWLKAEQIGESIPAEVIQSIEEQNVSPVEFLLGVSQGISQSLEYLTGVQIGQRTPVEYTTDVVTLLTSGNMPIEIAQTLEMTNRALIGHLGGIGVNNKIIVDNVTGIGVSVSVQVDTGTGFTTLVSIPIGILHEELVRSGIPVESRFQGITVLTRKILARNFQLTRSTINELSLDNSTMRIIKP